MNLDSEMLKLEAELAQWDIERATREVSDRVARQCMEEIEVLEELDGRTT